MGLYTVAQWQTFVKLSREKYVALIPLYHVELMRLHTSP
jgi:hypothetical protein